MATVEKDALQGLEGRSSCDNPEHILGLQGYAAETSWGGVSPYGEGFAVIKEHLPFMVVVAMRRQSQILGIPEQYAYQMALEKWLKDQGNITWASLIDIKRWRDLGEL